MQATGRFTAIPIAGCVIDRAVSSKKPCECVFRYSTIDIYISIISCSNPRSIATLVNYAVRVSETAWYRKSSNCSTALI